MTDLNFEDLLNNMAHTENLPPPYNRYEGLKKPDWTPPDSVFGPMWATLYLLMSFAGTFKYSGGGSEIRFYSYRCYPHFFCY